MDFSITKYHFEYELFAWEDKVYECAKIIYAGITIGTLTKFYGIKTGCSYIATVYGEGRKFKFSEKKYIKDFVNGKIKIHEWVMVSEWKRRNYKLTPFREFKIKD